MLIHCPHDNPGPCDLEQLLVSTTRVPS
uniref:Uncharacterized protein n=1 Tax=Anguilla anguilla TaxID=7936 RepID=A0A0E9R2N2_ANGAN